MGIYLEFYTVSHNLFVHKDQAHLRCQLYLNHSNLSGLQLQPGRKHLQLNTLLSRSSITYTLSKALICLNRYKESLSKSTRGLKEKLLAHNTSVKELSKGVQREMNAGIAGVARMIERFDLTSKRAGISPSDSDHDGVASNLSTKGKGVLENIIVQSLGKNTGKVADEASSDAASHPPIVIPGRVVVSRSQVLKFYYCCIVEFHVCV